MRLTARAAAYLRWQEHPKHPAPRVLAEPGPRAIHVKKLGDLLRTGLFNHCADMGTWDTWAQPPPAASVCCRLH